MATIMTMLIKIENERNMLGEIRRMVSEKLRLQDDQSACLVCRFCF